MVATDSRMRDTAIWVASTSPLADWTSSHEGAVGAAVAAVVLVTPSARTRAVTRVTAPISRRPGHRVRAAYPTESPLFRRNAIGSVDDPLIRTSRCV